MKAIHFDCFSGISGDMILGAIVNAGVNIKDISDRLKEITLTGYRLEAIPCKRNNISATKVNVVIDKLKHKDPIDYPKMRDIILSSTLSKEIKGLSISILEKLVNAEANVHGTNIKNLHLSLKGKVKPSTPLHLHEIGAIDTIVDIVGSIIGISILNPDKITASPINLGSGFIKTEHGIMPIPAPATAYILKGFPCYSSSINLELSTPTGAAIITTISQGFGNFRFSKLEQVGYGAGDSEIEGHPNFLRLLIGYEEEEEEKDSYGYKLLETNIDDMVPEFYDYISKRLFDLGAIDVFITPIYMKKNRPAIKLSVLVREDTISCISDIIFKETSTLGIRSYGLTRKELNREIIEIETKYGTIKIKIGKRDEKILNIAPEYESYKRAAELHSIPLKEAYEEAMAQARKILINKY